MMPYMFEKDILDRFRFALYKAQQAVKDCNGISDYRQFLLSGDAMILFDATVMRIQTVGETLKQIDKISTGEILKYYPEVPWRSVFAMRNFVSHEYNMVDPEKIFFTIKDDMPMLIEVLERIINDIENGKF